jgi:predicted transcriptional regulator
MFERREIFEEVADILRVGQAGKTELMFSAGMGYYQLQRHLDFLMGRGFLEREGCSYLPTTQGQQLCHLIDEVLQRLGKRR